MGGPTSYGATARVLEVLSGPWLGPVAHSDIKRELGGGEYSHSLQVLVKYGLVTKTVVDGLARYEITDDGREWLYRAYWRNPNLGY